MMRILPVVAVVCLLSLDLRPAQSQSVTWGLVGGASGVAAGGYVSLSVIVARAQARQYVHSMRDVLGWNSLPVLIGAPAGAALGFFAPERFQQAFLFGWGGVFAGLPTGMLVGTMLSDRPEAKWAGGAIGAGAGMAVGNLLGMLLTPQSDSGNPRPQGAVLPIGFRITFEP